MSLILGETKEDLHLRMSELQKKLRDSEEERRMLEKTCEILMKAFRDEQRMYYDALNSKYEQFLEDCNVRRRRNDIILRSLCRVEDKAKAIHAKTEKLKLLKDRYISYLKQNDFLKNEQPQRKVSSASQTVTGDEFLGKSVHWKTPIAADLQEYKAQDHEKNIRESSFGMRNKPGREESMSSVVRKDLNEKIIIDTMGYTIPVSTCQTQQELRESVQSNTAIITPTKMANLSNTSLYNGANYVESPFLSYSAHTDVTSIRETTTEKDFNSKIKPDLNSFEVPEKKVQLERQDSIDSLKATLENLHVNGFKKAMGKTAKNDENPEKFEFETNEKIIRPELDRQSVVASDANVQDFSVPHTNEESNVQWNFNGALTSEKSSMEEEEEQNFPRDEKTFIKGLDGVDYQNETYPESYYEQPVHLNTHTSLASKVILEEDEEYEEMDQEESGNSVEFDPVQKPQFPDIREPVTTQTDMKPSEIQNGGQIINGEDEKIDEEDNSSLNPSDKQNERPETFVDDNLIIDEVQSQGVDEEAKWPTDPAADDSKSDDYSFKLESESRTPPALKDLKGPGKSNLMQLLESDSESFQIEHGDMISGNDDSDFDFSFNQNP